jgi:hypothetical protein
MQSQKGRVADDPALINYSVAMAVHDERISAPVPEPSTIALMGLGLFVWHALAENGSEDNR